MPLFQKKQKTKQKTKKNMAKSPKILKTNKIEEKVMKIQKILWKHTIYSGDRFFQSSETLTLLCKLIEVSKSPGREWHAIACAHAIFCLAVWSSHA